MVYYVEDGTMPAMATRRTGRRPGRPRGAATGDDSSRERLIEAAARVFSARGYKGATVSAILADAGLSKGTFYWHFDSKEDLFFALLEERVEQPTRALMELSRAAPANAITAPATSVEVTRLMTEQRDLLLLIHEFWAEALRDERLKQRLLDWRATMVESVRQTLAARHEATGLEPTVPLEHLALAYIALASGLSQHVLIEPDTVPEELFGEVASLIYDGLALRAQRLEADES
jgi:AcrR family transcriptional regulator